MKLQKVIGYDKDTHKSVDFHLLKKMILESLKEQNEILKVKDPEQDEATLQSLPPMFKNLISEARSSVDHGDKEKTDYIKADKKPNLKNYIPPKTNDKRVWCASLRLKFVLAVISMIIASIVAFAILAFIVTLYSYYDLIGVWILISRGSASAVLCLTTFMFLFVSYDLLTAL